MDPILYVHTWEIKHAVIETKYVERLQTVTGHVTSPTQDSHTLQALWWNINDQPESQVIYFNINSSFFVPK